MNKAATLPAGACLAVNVKALMLLAPNAARETITVYASAGALYLPPPRGLSLTTFAANVSSFDFEVQTNSIPSAAP